MRFPYRLPTSLFKVPGRIRSTVFPVAPGGGGFASRVKAKRQMPFLSNRLRRHFSLPHAVTEICSTLHSAYSAGDDSIAILLSIPAICPPASSARLFSLRLLSRFLEGRPCPGDSPSGQTLQAHWSTFSDAYSLNGLGLPHRAYFSDHLTGFLLARDQPRYE